MTTENVALLFMGIAGSSEPSQRLPAEKADEAAETTSPSCASDRRVRWYRGQESRGGLMVVFSSASAVIGCRAPCSRGLIRGTARRLRPWAARGPQCGRGQ